MIDVHALLPEADECLKNGRYQVAADLYRRILAEEPTRIAAWVGLSMAQYRLKQFGDAAQTAARALTLDAGQIRACLVAAAALIELGHLTEAVRVANMALEIEPDNHFAWSSKTRALLNLERYAEALTAAESLLRLDPASPVAHLYHGNALHGLGEPLEALQAFDRALAINARFESAWANRSSVLLQLNRPFDALQAADTALEIQPDSPIALLNRAAALLSLRRYREALATTDQLLRIKPRHIKGLINKTVALLALRDYEAAWATLRTALTFDTFNPDALELKLQVLSGLKDYAEVVAEGQRLLAKHPDHPGMKLAVARALVTLGRRAEAEPLVDAVLVAAARQFPEAVVLKADILLSRHEGEAGRLLLEQALAEYPEHAPLWSAKSALLLASGDYAAALAAAERALALDADHLQAAVHRSAALNGLCRFSEALAVAGECLERGASDWQLYANQGGALAGLERFEEARQAFARARELDGPAFHAFRWRHESYGTPADALLPELDPRAESLALRVGRLERADWDDYDATIERAKTLTAQALAEGQLTPIPPFKSLLLPFSSELMAAIARSRGEFLAAGMAPVRQQRSFVESASAPERLRIGYVSADFRDHPTAHLMRGLFRVHDRTRFEIHVYALCPDDRSDYYQRIRADADRFVDLTGTSNAEAATRIHADGVHLLIDLMGYTASARSEIFALRPAPVQVSYLGYPGTLGADFIPYIIADPVVLPEELLEYFSECPVYLPDCYQVNDRWQDIAATGIRREDQNLPESGFVFCCFNQIQKLEPVMFAAWMRILRRVPDSVLWLYSDSEEAQANLRSTAAAWGIDGERLVFAKRLPKDRHLERHRLADLFLDTRLYNAHTTASDALWAGVPVLTCMGEMFPARVAASLLQAVGLPELITHSLEAYEERAVRLATRPAELAELRAKLAENRLRTPLFDTERFARHLERAYELMWERHVRGLPPAPLWVPSLPDGV